MSGDESGGFSFTVTDGEHTSPLSQFVVTVRPISITTVTQEELRLFPGTVSILVTKVFVKHLDRSDVFNSSIISII